MPLPPFRNTEIHREKQRYRDGYVSSCSYSSSPGKPIPSCSLIISPPPSFLPLFLCHLCLSSYTCPPGVHCDPISCRWKITFYFSLSPSYKNPLFIFFNYARAQHVGSYAGCIVSCCHRSTILGVFLADKNISLMACRKQNPVYLVFSVFFLSLFAWVGLSNRVTAYGKMENESCNVDPQSKNHSNFVSMLNLSRCSDSMGMSSWLVLTSKLNFWQD